MYAYVYPSAHTSTYYVKRRRTPYPICKRRPCGMVFATPLTNCLEVGCTYTRPIEAKWAAGFSRFLSASRQEVAGQWLLTNH